MSSRSWSTGRWTRSPPPRRSMSRRASRRAAPGRDRPGPRGRRRRGEAPRPACCRNGARPLASVRDPLPARPSLRAPTRFRSGSPPSPAGFTQGRASVPLSRSGHRRASAAARSRETGDSGQGSGALFGPGLLDRLGLAHPAPQAWLRHRARGLDPALTGGGPPPCHVVPLRCLLGGAAPPIEQCSRTRPGSAPAFEPARFLPSRVCRAAPLLPPRRTSPRRECRSGAGWEGGQRLRAGAQRPASGPDFTEE
jgi:hypothetical protein